MSIKNFLKKNGDVYVFTGDELHVYVPDDYFEKKLASDFGSSLFVFGLLNCQLFKAGKPVGGNEILNIPTMISMFPTVIEPETLTLRKGDEPERYQVAKFYNGDTFTHVNVAQDTDYVDTYIRIFTGGKLPRTIPYDKILTTWQKNLDIQGVNLGVPSNVLEIIIREIYRDPKKPQQAFAMKLNKEQGTTMMDYRGAGIREVCALNSTFAGMTYEYMDQMINSGINNSAYRKTQSDSPIEKIIKM